MTEKYFNEATVEQLSLEIMINNFNTSSQITEIAKPLIGTEREDIYYKLKDVLSQEGVGEFFKKMWDGFVNIIRKIIDGFKSLIDSILGFFSGKRKKLEKIFKNQKTLMLGAKGETTIRAYKNNQILYGALNNKDAGVAAYNGFFQLLSKKMEELINVINVKDRSAEMNSDEIKKLFGKNGEITNQFNSVYKTKIDLSKDSAETIVNSAFYGSGKPQEMKIQNKVILESIPEGFYKIDTLNQIKASTGHFGKIRKSFETAFNEMQKRSDEWLKSQDDKVKKSVKGRMEYIVKCGQMIGQLGFSFYKHYIEVIRKIEKIYDDVKKDNGKDVKTALNMDKLPKDLTEEDQKEIARILRKKSNENEEETDKELKKILDKYKDKD